MAVTSNTFTGDGSTTNYSFTFEYLEQDEVKVTLDGVATSAFTFANATTLSFTSAPTNGAEIRIYRDTNIDTLKATFFPGSAIKAEDLNDNFTQNNFVVQEIQNNTWDVDLQTIKSNEPWVSTDTQIATTAAMDQRFQDEVNDTLTKAELAALSDVIPDDDVAVPTTGAVKDYVDHVVETDILVDGTGLNKTASGGQVTIGISANSVDFDRIKNDDIITEAEQDAGSPSPADSNIFTASAAARRFDTLIQTSTPSGSSWEVGKTWLQNDDDKTLYMWNGSSWLPVVSGGTFTELSKVIYVDSINGDDTLSGHRISNPKKTIKAAVEDINADPDGDGSVVVVAPGIYGETFPIDIEKNDIAIVGTSLRNCIIHPAIPAADQAGYSVTTPEPNELETMFRVNSGGYFYGLTLTGMKASGARGGNALDTDATYGLPTNQGWNFAFFPNAVIRKSPYIQNCTNFSDSKINNVNFTPHTPGEGSAGDLTSDPSGGGILINGATVNSSSPLRSMVADSYTHTALDGPGIFVTNNGYTQITSSYAFFNHYHIKALNGGQANLAASTTDFGRYGLVVDGRSTSAIFTATTTATANDGDITFTVGAPAAQVGWHGSATRPQSNMLVDIGGNTYPILSSVANGAGWDVTISRPNPSKRDENLGLDGAVTSGSAVSFYLRSQIASSGHTMEYVGSGTDYNALPENGGVPVEANQVVELNNGKVWTATTDHNGKFKVGDFFTVDQRTGFVTVPVGSISFPVLAEDLDVNGHNIFDSTGNVKINDTLDLTSNKIVNVTNPTAAQDAATKNYVDSTFVELAGDTMTGALALPSGTAGAPSLSVGTTDNGIYSPGADQVAISTNGTGRLFVDSSGRVGVGTSPNRLLHIKSADPILRLEDNDPDGVYGEINGSAGNLYLIADGGNSSASSFIAFRIDGEGSSSEKLRIDSSGRVGIGTSSPDAILVTKPSGAFSTAVDTFTGDGLSIDSTNSTAGSGNYGPGISWPSLGVSGNRQAGICSHQDTADVNRVGLAFFTHPSNTSTDPIVEALRISSAGNVGIGTTSPDTPLTVGGSNAAIRVQPSNVANASIFLRHGSIATNSGLEADSTASLGLYANGQERARIDGAGRLLVGTTSTSANASALFQGIGGSPTGAAQVRIALGSTAPGTNDALGYLIFSDSGHSNAAWVAAHRDGGTWTSGSSQPSRLVFSTTRDGSSSPEEHLFIYNTGKISAYSGVTGVASDYSFSIQNDGNNANRYGLAITCGADNAAGTNYAIDIRDGDGTNQGYVTFTGGTVTYGAFTAHHPCILPDADNEAGYAYGTLLEITSIEYTQKDGQDTERGILYNVRKTQTANSRAVLGAYGSSMNGGPDGETNRHQALVLGDGHILCNNSGGNIKVGDGICSSATPGIGQKATATPSMAIGIAQEDVTFAGDDEVKLVAVQYGVRQFTPWGD